MGKSTQNESLPAPGTNAWLLNQLKWRHDFAQLATDVRNGKISHDEAYKRIAQRIEGCSRRQEEEAYALFDYLLSSIKTPHNAISDIMAYSSDLYVQYNGRMQFPIFLPRVHHKLFIAILILGARGRAFIFARNAVGNTLGLSPMSVQRFLQSLLTRNLIRCIRKGIQFKQSSWYQFCNEDLANAWLNIGKFLKVDNALETGTTIRKRFEWMFTDENIMNRPMQQLGN